MPTYRNDNDYAISLYGTTILSGGTYVSERTLLGDELTLISELPYPTTLSLETTFANSNFYKNSSLSFLYQAALGIVPGVSAYKKFGYATVTTANTTIWDSGGLYAYLSAPATLKVASTNTADTLGGIGANKVKVEGLQETETDDWNFFSVEVELSGQTPVTVIEDVIRVYRMYVTLSGTNGGAIGTVAISDGTFTLGNPDGKTLAQIVNGNNQTLMAMMSIPSGYTGIITDYFANSGKSGELTIDSVIRRYGTNTFNIVRRIMLYERTFVFPNDTPFIISEKSDIEIRGKALATSAPCAAGFDILLVRNS